MGVKIKGKYIYDVSWQNCFYKYAYSLNQDIL